MDKIKNDPNSLSLFLNMTNLISTIHPKVLAWILIDGILGSANIMVNIYIPKIVIDFIVGRTYIDSFVVLVLGLFIVKLCLYYFAELATKKSEDERIIFNRKLLAHFSHKANKISYPYLESPESLELKEAARAPIIYGTIWKILSDLSSIVVSLFTIIGIVLILIRFSLALFALVTILSLISVIIESRLIQALIDMQKQFIPLNTKYNYYFDQFYDEDRQKEFRTYNNNQVLINKLAETNEEFIGASMEMAKLEANSHFISSIFNNLSRFIIYSYAGLRVLAFLGPQISLGNFSVLIGPMKTMQAL